MTPLQVTGDLDACPWSDLRVTADEVGELSRIGLLRHGTTEGRASVGLLVTLPDGTHVLAQTTWRLLSTAVNALAAGPVASEEVSD